MPIYRVCGLDLVEITAKSLAGYAHLQGMQFGLGRDHGKVTCRVCALAGYAVWTWSRSRQSHLQGMRTYRVCGLDLVEITAKSLAGYARPFTGYARSLAGYAHLQGMQKKLGQNREHLIYRVCSLTGYAILHLQ